MTIGAVLKNGGNAGGYCEGRKYVKDELPNWTRCGDCQARVLPGSPQMHDSDCRIKHALVTFGLGR